MKTILFVFLFVTVLSDIDMNAQKTYNLLVGTYTRPGKSEGIYVYRFNTETGELSEKSKAAGITNPSFLTTTKDRKFVYAVSETDDGTVNAYKFDAKTGILTYLNSASAGGSSPCYVSVDPKNKFVFVGNYGGGSLTAIPLNADGSFGTKLQTIVHEGKSVKSNQDKSHVHATVLSPDGRFLYVPDLGTDKIFVYQVDVSKATPLTPASPPFVSVDPGNGPRHFTFDPSGKMAFLIQEMTGVVTSYTVSSGKLTPKQSVSLPAEGTTEHIDAADIHISADGKFLYGSLRGDVNEIVVYSLDKAGNMTYAGRHSTLGKTPRNFAIDPSGKFLLVAHQNSDDIRVFKRDAKSGLLTPTDKTISIGAPVCLKFAPEK